MSPSVLKRFVGTEVNVFGERPEIDEDRALCLVSYGFLVGIERGCLLLSETEGGEAEEVVDLSIVRLVARIKYRDDEAPPLKALPGGKLLKLRPGRSAPEPEAS